MEKNRKIRKKTYNIIFKILNLCLVMSLVLSPFNSSLFTASAVLNGKLTVENNNEQTLNNSMVFIENPNFTSTEYDPISADLIDALPNPAMIDEDINVSYNINIESIVKDDNNNDSYIGKDVIFLLDKSSGMRGSNGNNQLFNAIEGNINKFQDSDNTKIGFISYNEQAYTEKINNQELIQYSSSNQGTIQGSLNNIKQSNFGEDVRDIGKGLKLASEVLENSSNTDAKKMIVIFANDEVINSLNNNEFDEIINKNYEYIFVQMDCNYQSKHQLKSLDSIFNLLNTPHNNNTYIIDLDDCTTPNTHNNNMLYSTVNEIFDLIKGSSLSKITPPISEAKLIFDLGSDFEAHDRLEKEEQERHKYIYPLKNIEFEYEDGVFIPKIKNQIIDFSVRGKEVGESKTFISAQLSYINQNGVELFIDIESPIVSIVESNSVTNDPYLKILEIQPVESFVLTQNQDAILTGIEEITVGGNKIEIHHITMPEFIGKIDRINGKYDVIVIGEYSGTYTSAFRNKPNYIYNGNAGTTLNDGASDTQIEYYSENDITDKRSKEVLSLIDSGQLVYIQDSILSNTETKLYNNFGLLEGNGINTYQNISVEKIVEDYSELDRKFKKPIVNIIQSPSSDTGVGEFSNRTLGFGFEIFGLPNESLNIELFLDLNGDGLFRESDNELKTPQGYITIVLDDEGYARISDKNFYYNMPTDFIGQLTWKLQVKRTNTNYDESIYSYETGRLILNRTSNQEKIDIHVLQVVPDCDKSNGKYKCALNNNSDFNNLIQELDYNITLDVVSVSKFNDLKLDNNQSLNLNQYDMIIIGFSDSYDNKEMSVNAIRELKAFIETGQSVMFTHDTMTHWYKDESIGRLTREFRTILGQARYNPYEEYTATIPIQLKEDIVYDVLSTSSSIYIPERLRTMGYSTVELDRYRNGKSGAFPYTNSVYQVNSGQITEYPFDLESENSVINVARTHYQYFQLNLEQENLVPWYTLTGTADAARGKYNPYDVRNNYYTYSIGNLTYSGTGHTNDLSAYPTSEIKLFINTIVKAIRGANKAPTFNVFNLENGTDYFDKQSSIDFSITPFDIDKDLMSVYVTVMNNRDSELIKLEYANKKDNENFNVSIPNSVFSDLSGSSIKIKIEVVDVHGAPATPQEYVVNITNDEKLQVLFIPNSGYLVGDIATMNATFIKQSDLNNSYKFNEFEFVVENTDIDNILSIIGENTGVSSETISKDNPILEYPFQYKISEHASIPYDPNYAKSVNLQLNYAYEKSHSNNGNGGEGEEFSGEVSGTINIREGRVTVQLVDIEGNPITSIQPNLYLESVSEDEDVNRDKIPGQFDSISGSVTFRNVPTGNYKIVIEPQPGYNFTEAYKIVDSEAVITPIFKVSYEDNNHLLYISLQNVTIQHGLYKGFSNSQVLIDEEKRVLQAGIIAQFAASFSLLNDSNRISLVLDPKIEFEIASDIDLHIYQVSDSRLQEISGIAYEINETTNSISFDLKDKLLNPTLKDVIILYNGRLNESSTNYKNIITILSDFNEVEVATNDALELPDLL